MGLQNYCLLIALSLQVCYAQRVVSAFPGKSREFYQPYTPSPNENRRNEPAYDAQPSNHGTRDRYLSAQEQQKSLQSLLHFVEKERSSSQSDVESSYQPVRQTPQSHSETTYQPVRQKPQSHVESSYQPVRQTPQSHVESSYQPVQQNVPVLPLPPKPLDSLEAPLRVHAIPISHGKLQEIGPSREYGKAPVNRFFANQGVAGSVRLSSTGAKTAPFQSREKTVEVNGIHVPVMSKMVKNTKLNFLETENTSPVSEKFSSFSSVTHPKYNNVIDIDGVTVPSRSKMVKNAKINLLQSSVQFFGSKGQPAGSQQVTYPNRHRNMIDLDGIQVPHMSKMIKNTKLNILQQTSQFVEKELSKEELNTRAYNQADVYPTVKPKSYDIEEPVEPNVQGFRVRGDSSNRIIFLDVAELGFNIDSGSLKLGNSELIPVDGASISTPNAGALPNAVVAADVNHQPEHVRIHKDALGKMVSTHIQHDPSIHEAVDISQYNALPSLIKSRPQNTKYLRGPQSVPSPNPPTFQPSSFDLSVRPVSKSTKSKPRPVQSKVFFKKVYLNQKGSKKESKIMSQPSRKPLGSKQHYSSSKTSFSSFPSRSKTTQSLPGRPDGPKQADNKPSFHRFSTKSSEPEAEVQQTPYQQQTQYEQPQQQTLYPQPQQQVEFQQPQQQSQHEQPQQQQQTYYEEPQQQSQHEQPQQQTYYEEPQQQSQYEQPQQQQQTYYEKPQQQQQTYYEEPQQQQNHYEEHTQQPQQQSYYEEPHQNIIQTNYDAQKTVQDGVNAVLRQQAAVLELQKQHARITQEAQHQPNHFHQQLHQPQQSLLQHFQLPYQQPVVHGPQVPGLAEHSRYVVELQAAQQALGAIQG